jgi:hypothetical protein
MTKKEVQKYILPLALSISALCILGLGFLITKGNSDQEPLAVEAVPLSQELSAQAFEKCLETQDVAVKVSCWTEFIEQKMYSEGLEKTFESFREIYKADPVFVAEGCHGAVHSIGEIAYAFYKSGGQILFSEDASSCGYGFYHGFIGKLLHEKPDIQEAVKFCGSLQSELNGYDETAYNTCFHGIGHGMVEEEPLSEYYWGNFDALLVPALKLCSTLPEEFMKHQCVDGAFNGLNKFMVHGLYGYTYNTADPFAWCDQFKDNRINFMSCHFETAQSFVPKGVITEDLTTILPYIEELDQELQIMVLDTAIGNFMQSDIIKEDNSKYFRQCAAFTDPIYARACLNGIVGGFFAYGEPGNEAKKAQVFCDSPAATEDQRLLCKELMVSYVQ